MICVWMVVVGFGRIVWVVDRRGILGDPPMVVSWIRSRKLDGVEVMFQVPRQMFAVWLILVIGPPLLLPVDQGPLLVLIIIEEVRLAQLNLLLLVPPRVVRMVTGKLVGTMVANRLGAGEGLPLRPLIRQVPPGLRVVILPLRVLPPVR